MKFSSSSAILVAAVRLTAAFPAGSLEAFQNDPEMVARARSLVSGKREAGAGADAATLIFEAIPTFDAASQYIDVSEGSGHEWQAPGPGDLRGPCPGLNALANHGFLPRNGYPTVLQYIDTLTTVVGMGVDLAGFLAVLGALIDSGDLTSWSLGGTPGPQFSIAAQNGHGLIGSHNKYEGDGSPTRPDLYEYGNNYIPMADNFQGLIDYSPNGITIDSLAAWRSYRFDQSVANNPYFFAAPFPGLLVVPAAYQFAFRFMANHSEENPIGYFSHEVAQSWWGMAGENGNYTVQFGYERIPENWYRRSHTAPYTIPYFVGDVAAAAAVYPKFLSVGGNLGKTNTFTGVDIQNLTGGIFDSAGLLQGNNLGCFAFQAAAQVKSDFVLLDALNELTDAVGSIVTQLSCPQLQELNEFDLEQFPGFTRSPAFNSSAA